MLWLLCVAVQSAALSSFCRFGNACWPNANDREALSSMLDPSLNRTLVWAGPGYAYPLAIPAGATQPLFGAGRSLRPLYYLQPNSSEFCFQNYSSSFCDVSTRNKPYSIQPSFVVWPTTNAHVQRIVEFAKKHKLRICVAGTGHDLLNRHSCDQGILVRTGLFKEMMWNLTATSEAPSGTVKVGSGHTFSELHQSAAAHDRVLVSGWSPTVGIAGWSMGGGYGPFTPRFGLGPDNILEMEVITGDGQLRIVNKSSNPDLFFAIRGGGGSTWGVVTSYTLRAHLIPEGGFTLFSASWGDSMCGEGESRLIDVVDNFHNWALAIDSKWGGSYILMSSKAQTANCTANWAFVANYAFQGSSNNSEFQSQIETMRNFTDTPPSISMTTFANWWQYVQTADPGSISAQPTSSQPGLNSVIVNRTMVPQLVTTLKTLLLLCKAQNGSCPFLIVGQGLTGNVNSPQDPTTALNPGMRSGLLHVMALSGSTTAYYPLGEYSYFGESQGDMQGWQHRYFGDKYPRLLAIKRSYDPENRFGCHHCVGDGEAGTETGNESVANEGARFESGPWLLAFLFMAAL